MSDNQVVKMDNINLQDIKTVKYLDLECLIYTGENFKDYINVSKWVNERRDFSNWYRLSSTKELIKFFTKKIGRSDLILSIMKISNEYRGTYMHIDLAIQFAQWISPEFAYNVSQLVKSHIIAKYEKQICEKDDTINELKLKMDEMLKNSYQILDDNKKTHSELKNVSKDLKQANDNIEELTELVSEIAIDTVPTSGWNKFGLFKVIDESGITYRVVRCKKSDYNSRIKRYKDDELIFEIDLPNGIEYFSTFRNEYSKNKLNNKITIFFNTITLNKNTTEDDLMVMLKQHEVRIQKLISSTM